MLSVGFQTSWRSDLPDSHLHPSAQGLGLPCARWPQGWGGQKGHPQGKLGLMWHPWGKEITHNRLWVSCVHWEVTGNPSFWTISKPPHLRVKNRSMGFLIPESLGEEFLKPFSLLQREDPVSKMAFVSHGSQRMVLCEPHVNRLSAQGRGIAGSFCAWERGEGSRKTLDVLLAAGWSLVMGGRV